MMTLVGISWFLWSTVYPGGTHDPANIVTRPVKEFASQQACEQALPRYRKEAEKAFPQPAMTVKPGESYMITWPTVRLECSPIYPR